jgi:nicotinamidase-related amidase
VKLRAHTKWKIVPGLVLLVVSPIRIFSIPNTAEHIAFDLAGIGWWGFVCWLLWSGGFSRNPPNSNDDPNQNGSLGSIISKQPTTDRPVVSQFAGCDGETVELRSTGQPRAGAVESVLRLAVRRISMSTTLENFVTTGADFAEGARRALEAERCALVVVDIQEKLLPPIFQKEQLVRNAKLLIRAAVVLKIPALMSTQYAKGLGGTVPEVASLLPETEAIDKNLFSCFGSDVFCTLLKRLPGKRNTLLLCGMESHICVTQTALAALREGYIVHVASDAVSSRTEWNWKIGLERMRAAGAVISSTEMMIYELMRSSASPAFKEMLPYLKG